MKLEKHHTDRVVLTELIGRIVQRRISLGLTQQDVVERTGISLRTIKRIELGGDAQFSTIIRLLLAYDLTDRLNILVPEPSVSPIQFVEQQQKRRKRVSKTAKSKKQWKWGDEQ